MSVLIIEQVVKKLTKTGKMYSCEEFFSLPFDILNKPGIYAFYFKDMPSCALTDKHEVPEDEPLYIGMSDKRTLLERIDEHHDKTAAESTLRFSLGVLFQEEMGFSLRITSGVPPKFRFCQDGENWISRWINNNALIRFVEYKNPASIERRVIRKVSPSLNIEHSENDFVSKLRRMRALARAKARRLPPLK